MSTDINFIPIQSSLHKSTEISTDINFIPIQSSFHSLTRDTTTTKTTTTTKDSINSRTQKMTERDGKKKSKKKISQW